MADAPWLAKAKTLAAGQSTKIVCCSDDRSMIVSNGRRGYSGYCFRCGASPFEAHGEFSIQMIAQRKRELELIEERDVRLPKDFTLDIPTAHAIWLFKAGIDGDLARKYGIGYSKYLDRVIFPVYMDGELVAYTARARFGKPKYIEKARDSNTIFVADPTLRLTSYSDFSGPDIVLVEDNLSAIRVGRVARHVVSLMGTSCNEVQLSAVFSRGGLQLAREASIAVWLDPDAAGIKATRQIERALLLRGHRVRSITSDLDPKYYSYRQIKEYLAYD